jgi:hypothetical protein
VQSDTEADGRSGEDGEAEAKETVAQVGSDSGREGQRGNRGRGDQVQKWKDFWQRTDEQGREEGGEEGRDAEESEEKGARMWGGDDFDEGIAVEKGKLRAWFGNIRRFKVDNSNVAHISQIENRMWDRTKAYGVALSGLADTGMSVGPGNQGHLSLLHNAGQMGAKARAHWGCDGMGWSV